VRPSTLVLLTALVAAGAAESATAQTSQFGSRGLGLPTRAYSARSLGLGGGLSLFEGESALSPAALGSLTLLNAMGTATTNWRDSQSPFGEAIGRDTRYSLIQVGGPIHTNNLGQVRVAAGLSISAYGDRNFGLGSVDSLVIRGEKLEVRDTLLSRGGLSDMRAAVAWNVTPALTVGTGMHLITGVARVRSARVVISPDYDPVAEVSEVSYLGYGASVGFNLRLGQRVTLAGLARSDAPVAVERDTVDAGKIELPMLLGAGLRVALHSRLLVAGHLVHRGWGSADETIRDLGGVGARNSLEASGGFEWSRNSRNVTKWPVRLGAHYSTLPFPLTTGGKGKEVGVSVGTGARFGPGARGGFDLALERVWRSEGAPWREQAFLLTVGITLRP